MFKKLFPSSQFGKNVLMILTGSSIAQAIPLAVSPILTRLYEPEDFGVFALYVSIVGILSIFATGRFEMAIMLPKDKSEVRALSKLIIILNLSISVLLLIVIIIFNKQISELLGSDGISYFLYFIPLSVLLVGFYQLVSTLLVRDKLFKQTAMNKILFSGSNVSCQLSHGLLFSGSFGLLLGNVIGYLVAISSVLKSKVINYYLFFKEKDSSLLVAKKYIQFPKYDVPSVFVNVLANQAPVLGISRFFGMELLGFYSFTYKTLMQPISLISKSVLEVFKQKATEDYNEQGNCKGIFLSTLKNLALVGFVPFLILFFIAPSLFAFVFGDKWVIAGELAQIMTPMFYLNFVVGPLSYTFFIVGQQKKNLFWQFILLIFSVIAISIGVFYDDFYLAIGLFSLVYSVIYIIYLLYAYQFSKGGRHAQENN